MHRRHRGLLLAAVLVAGCASGSLTRIGGDGSLPEELPTDLQEKFEVKETVAMVAPPAPASIPASSEPEAKAAAKPSKRKKGPAPAPATAAFAWPSRRPPKDPIWPSEKSVFEITYFGMAAGDFTLDVLPYKEINRRKVYHIRGTAVSSKVFSLFYRLNDTIETFIDYDGLFSHRFHLQLDETKQTRDSLELFDSEKAQTFYWNRWNHRDKGYSEKKEFQPITPFSQDSLSALFYLRTVPLPEGAVITFPVVSEGKTWEAVVTVVRREMLKTPMGRVQTVVVKPETKYQGILQKRGDSFLWMTDDDRRHLVRLEAKVRVGTIVASLKKIEPGTPPPP
jgi:hypothetical protein